MQNTNVDAHNTDAHNTPPRHVAMGVDSDGHVEMTLPDDFDYSDNTAVLNICEALDHLRAVLGLRAVPCDQILVAVRGSSGAQ